MRLACPSLSVSLNLREEFPLLAREVRQTNLPHSESWKSEVDKNIPIGKPGIKLFAQNFVISLDSPVL